jgi:hypothetical protein
MSSFGAICDDYWSCMPGANNIVLNSDRWNASTTTWQKAGGTMADYHALMINHETGHWLGFDHLPCGGAGQSAPVMMQQSINLGGCTFNPWPLPSEQAALLKTLGL